MIELRKQVEMETVGYKYHKIINQRKNVHKQLIKQTYLMMVSYNKNYRTKSKFLLCLINKIQG